MGKRRIEGRMTWIVQKGKSEPVRLERLNADV